MNEEKMIETKTKIYMDTLFSVLWIFLNSLMVLSIVAWWEINLLILSGIGQTVLIGVYSSPPSNKRILFAIGWIIILFLAFSLGFVWVMASHYDEFIAWILVGLVLGLGQWLFLYLNKKNGGLCILSSFLGMFVTSVIIYGEVNVSATDSKLLLVLGSLTYGIISGVPFSYFQHSKK